MARNFNGNALNYLSTTTTAIVAGPATAYTIAGWMRPTTLGQANTLYGQGVVSGNDYITLELDPSNRAGLLSKAGGVTAADAVSSTTVPLLGLWHHLCGVQSNVTLRTAYLDGAGAGTSTTSNSPTATNCAIGGLRLSAVFNPCAGDIAEVAVWSVALDAAEVTALAAGASPLLIRPTSLRSYWPLVGNASPEPDLRPLGATMTVVGTVGQATHPRVFYPKRRPVGVFFPSGLAYPYPARTFTGFPMGGAVNA